MSKFQRRRSAGNIPRYGFRVWESAQLVELHLCCGSDTALIPAARTLISLYEVDGKSGFVHFPAEL
jgi:hypothetical protein